MTTKTLASITLALIVAATAATGAEARTRHQDDSVQAFDRHAVTEIAARMFIRDVRPQKVSGLKQIRKRRQGPGATRAKNAQVRIEARSSGSPHLLVATSGARTSVSTVARPHFQCLLTKLDAVGYHVDFMGGYASRGNASAHPTGNALDINQTARNVVTRRLPPNATEMARDCGLVHGAVWSHPDQGHFEMPKKYGYIHRRARTRYAAAR